MVGQGPVVLAAGMAWKLLDLGGGGIFNIKGVLPGNKW